MQDAGEDRWVWDSTEDTSIPKVPLIEKALAPLIEWPDPPAGEQPVLPSLTVAEKLSSTPVATLPDGTKPPTGLAPPPARSANENGGAKEEPSLISLFAESDKAAERPLVFEDMLAAELRALM